MKLEGRLSLVISKPRLRWGEAWLGMGRKRMQKRRSGLGVQLSKEMLKHNAL